MILLQENRDGTRSAASCPIRERQRWSLYKMWMAFISLQLYLCFQAVLVSEHAAADLHRNSFICRVVSLGTVAASKGTMSVNTRQHLITTPRELTDSHTPTHIKQARTNWEIHRLSQWPDLYGWRTGRSWLSPPQTLKAENRRHRKKTVVRRYQENTLLQLGCVLKTSFCSLRLLVCLRYHKEFTGDDVWGTRLWH